MGQRETRFRIMLVGILTSLAVVSARSPADTVYLQSGTGKPVPLEGVKVEGMQNQNLRFTTAAGVSNTKPLDHVPEIHIDGESVFSAAETEFAQSDWTEAADKYRWVIGHNSPDWIKLRSATRLAETAEKTGKTDDAVIAFVARTKLLPAADLTHAPKVESIPSAQLDSAIAILNQAVADPKLGKEQKVLLLKYLMELHNFAVAAVSQQLKQLAPPPPPPPKPPEPRHPAPASPPVTNEPPRLQFEKAIEAARRARETKIATTTEEFKAAAAEAFRRLSEQRKAAFDMAVATFDFKIKEITKTGDLDKALDARAEKARYIAAATHESEELAKEWDSLSRNLPTTAPSTMPSVDKQPPLEGFLPGTKWAWGRGDEGIQFKADGTVVEAYWTSIGLTTRWEVIDHRTAMLLIVKGRSYNRLAILKFRDDLSGYDLIDFDGSAHGNNARITKD